MRGSEGSWSPQNGIGRASGPDLRASRDPKALKTALNGVQKGSKRVSKTRSRRAPGAHRSLLGSGLGARTGYAEQPLGAEKGHLWAAFGLRRSVPTGPSLASLRGSGRAFVGRPTGSLALPLR